MGFTVKKRVLRRVLRKGSEKGVSRRCPERPLREYDPLGVRPNDPFPNDPMSELLKSASLINELARH